MEVEYIVEAAEDAAADKLAAPTIAVLLAIKACVVWQAMRFCRPQNSTSACLARTRSFLRAQVCDRSY